MLEAKVVKTVVAADYRIMKLAENGDLIITQDYGLASLGLAKGCTVLHHSGYSYTNENIDQLLQTRYLSAMARKSRKRTKGPNHLQQGIGRNLEGFKKNDFTLTNNRPHIILFLVFPHFFET